MKVTKWKTYRTVFGCAMGLALAVWGVGAAGQSSPGGDRPSGGDLIALFTMNNLSESAGEEGEIAPARHHALRAPRLIPFGGSLVAEGQNGVEFSDAEGERHEAGKAVAWGSGINDPPPNGMVMVFDSVAYESMRLRFDVRSTRTGSPFMLVEYRLRGREEFRQIGERIGVKANGEYQEVNVDLSGLTGINGKSDVELRWVLAPGTSGNGTTRIDNIQITGRRTGQLPRVEE